MNKKYFDRLKKIKTKNLVQFLSGISVIISPLFCLLAFSSKKWIWFVYFACITLLSIIVVVKCSATKKCTEEKTPYSILAKDKVTFEAIKNNLLTNYNVSTKEYSQSQVFFFKSKMRYRFTLYQIDDFSIDEFMRVKKNTNNKVNRDFQITNKVSFYNNKRCAINVIVTKQENAELLDFLSKDASVGMRRFESIINVALCEESGNVLIPPLLTDVTWLSAKKYDCNVKLICDLSNVAYKCK